MLVRLISASQIILLCGPTSAFLFYSGTVYRRQTTADLSDLPEREGGYRPLWTLIDLDSVKQGQPLDLIQISGRSRHALDQWELWSKQCRAALFGLPLWNTEELM
jgi:hypothetical protein